MTTTDEFWYMRYTGPQEVEKVLSVLSGILIGITSDASISRFEVNLLNDWQSKNEKLLVKKPFDEVGRSLKCALEDGVITGDEKDDLLWLCDPARYKTPYFNDVTRKMQQLHGIMKGIAVDGVITKAEVEFLKQWLINNDDLEALWPYSELMTLVVEVLSDGVIDSREHEMLLGFCNGFVGDGFTNERLPGELPQTLSGICELGPEVIFDGQKFCFTGICSTHSRSQLSGIVNSHGGVSQSNVTRDLNYLVVCDNGNPAWAFSAYGRKVERVMDLRKKGAVIRIIHEMDFFDSIID